MKIRCMTPEDLPHAASFTASEGWSSETLTTFESFHAYDPAGCFIAEKNKRRAGICVATGYSRAGFVGELIIDPGLRNRGEGRQLLEHAISYLESRGISDIHLDGVVQAVPLYERMGFRRVCRSLRYAGHLEGKTDPAVRRMTETDLPAVLALDRDVFGDDRGFFLRWFLHRTPELCLVLDEGRGPLGGFIFGRHGNGSVAAGPWVVSPGTRSPERLLQGLAATCEGCTIGLGVLETSTASVAAVESLNLRRHPDPPWRMVLGQAHRLGDSDRSWAVGSAAKG